MIVKNDNDEPLYNEKEYARIFLKALRHLHGLYTKFPKFMIEIMAENFGVPSSEVKELISLYKRRGFLILVKNEGYCYQLNIR